MLLFKGNQSREYNFAERQCTVEQWRVMPPTKECSIGLLEKRCWGGTLWVKGQYIQCPFMGKGSIPFYLIGWIQLDLTEIN